MSEHQTMETSIPVPGAGAGHRRTAPDAEPSSDVTRFRGLWLAALVAFSLALVAVVWFSDRSALTGAPGPLSLPHEEAGLACQACHVSGEQVSTQCVGCHGARTHTRDGHAKLSRQGRLACAHCHAVHRDHGGAVFWPDGSAARFVPGRVVRVSGPETSWYRPAARVIVPIIPARACAPCHDMDRPDDPALACALAGTQDLGASRPTLCLDEHRAVGAPGSSGARSVSRDAAWQAARDVASALPAPAADTDGALGPLAWVLGALGLGLVSWLVPRAFAAVRGRARQRSARERDTTVAPPRERRLPTVNTSTCIGCYACVDACPYDVLEVRAYVAVVARPADCCGLTLCEQRCPNGSLTMGDGVPVTDSPLVSENLESEDRPGIYLAGDITGLPLIRNAINQGAFAARQVAADLARHRDKHTGEVLDVIIVGAGPAGLSAALAAQDAGLSYLVLEQSSVAASIHSFPRGKLVFDQPLEMPLIGDLWLERSTKEELLSQWTRIVRRHAVRIRENARVSSIECTSPTPDGRPLSADERRALMFEVCAQVGGDGAGDGGAEKTLERFSTRRVIVALGRRGSPRRLSVPIPPACESWVFYNLADARSLAGQRVLVVGLGDVAMEAALALSEQPGTRVTISYRGPGFRRGKARTIEAIERQVAAGAIDLCFETEVRALEPGVVYLGRTGAGRSDDDPVAVPCDAMLVSIGSIPSFELLRAFGLRVPETSQMTSQMTS